MTIFTFIYLFGPASRPAESATLGGGRVCRLVARHRLTDEERRNLRSYYRRNPVGAPAIMTASLGGHPQRERRQR